MIFYNDKINPCWLSEETKNKFYEWLKALIGNLQPWRGPLSDKLYSPLFSSIYTDLIPYIGKDFPSKHVYTITGTPAEANIAIMFDSHIDFYLLETVLINSFVDGILRLSSCNVSTLHYQIEVIDKTILEDLRESFRNSKLIFKNQDLYGVYVVICRGLGYSEFKVANFDILAHELPVKVESHAPIRFVWNSLYRYDRNRNRSLTVSITTPKENREEQTDLQIKFHSSKQGMISSSTIQIKTKREQDLITLELELNADASFLSEIGEGFKEWEPPPILEVKNMMFIMATFKVARVLMHKEIQEKIFGPDYERRIASIIIPCISQDKNIDIDRFLGHLGRCLNDPDASKVFLNIPLFAFDRFKRLYNKKFSEDNTISKLVDGKILDPLFPFVFLLQMEKR